MIPSRIVLAGVWGWLLVAATGILCAAPVAAGAALSIEHAPLECVAGDTFPRVSAQVLPPEQVALVWVHFRGQEGSGWYSIRLQPDDAGHSGVLPRPKWLERFSYYIEALDLDGDTHRSEEFTTAVEDSAAKCGDRLGDFVDVAQGIVVDRPSGAGSKTPVVPRGFSSRGTAGGDAGMVELPPGRTRLLVGGLLGGAVVGILAQLQPESDPGPPAAPPYDIRFVASTPPPGGSVSLAGGMSLSLAVSASVSAPRPVRFVRVDFVVQPVLCASMFAPVLGELPQQVLVAGPFERTSAAVEECRAPYTTTSVQARLLGEAYAPISGASTVSLGVNYTMEP